MYTVVHVHLRTRLGSVIFNATISGQGWNQGERVANDR